MVISLRRFLYLAFVARGNFLISNPSLRQAQAHFNELLVDRVLVPLFRAGWIPFCACLLLSSSAFKYSLVSCVTS